MTWVCLKCRIKISQEDSICPECNGEMTEQSPADSELLYLYRSSDILTTDSNRKHLLDLSNLV